MILNSIKLENFRLHINTEVSFSKNLNFIIGGNGQGKTTILEAIYYLCTTKNLSQSPDYEAVNFGSDYFQIFGNFSGRTSNKVKINYNSKKSVLVDDKPVHKTSEFIGKFPVVTLTPVDHFLTTGSPSHRRKFVDSVISQASTTYLKYLIDFNKTLKQRSYLLNLIKETNNYSLIDELDAWSNTLIKNGTEIVKHRIDFINTFNKYISHSYSKIVENEKPLIKYSFLGIDNNKQDVEQKFRDEINLRKNEELARTKNLVGPHLDDFSFSINGLELKKFGSQGQHKTFQISLRFAQFFYLKETLSKTPLFLMDDIFGELDTSRANDISKYLSKIGQAFITMTDFSNFEKLKKSENSKMLSVENGKIISE